MAVLRRPASSTRRDALLELELVMLDYMVGTCEEASQRRRVDDLRSRRPVLVHHGYQVDLPGEAGPFCLEADDSLTPVEAVYVDPDAAVRTVLGYRRPDGSEVDGHARGGGHDLSRTLVREVIHAAR